MTEYRLVYKLLKTPGIAVNKDALADEMGSATAHGVLATHISGIRKKFKDVDSQFVAIETEPGKGYAWRSS